MPLVTQVTLVGVGVGEVPFDGEVDRRLCDFAKRRRQAVDEREDE